VVIGGPEVVGVFDPVKGSWHWLARIMALTRRQEAVALLLIAGRSVEAITRETGISRRSIFRWQGDAQFAAAVIAMRKQRAGDVLDQLTGMLGEATDALRELLKTKNERVRLAAIQTVFDRREKMVDQQEILGRLAALEAAEAKRAKR
jgi:hypothetical protein